MNHRFTPATLTRTKQELMVSFERALDMYLSKFPAEIVRRAEAAETEELRQSEPCELEGLLWDVENAAFDSVCSPWHVEGYDTLGNYLHQLAPTTTEALLDAALNIPLYGDRHRCVELVEFASVGAAKAIRSAMDKRDVTEEADEDAED